jgi:hypothetical protein
MKPTFKCVYRPYGRISIQDSKEGSLKLPVVGASIAIAGQAAPGDEAFVAQFRQARCVQNAPAARYHRGK